MMNKRSRMTAPFAVGLAFASACTSPTEPDAFGQGRRKGRTSFAHRG